MNKSNITITDRFIYNLIKSYNLNEKPFFASNEYLAKELNKSQSVISHSISRLLSLGYLTNKGNKMCRQLYVNNDLLSADFDKENAINNKESAENSILLEDIKKEFAKNSNNKKLKTAIESAENSNILISILISYTNIKKNTKEKKYPTIEEVKEYATTRDRLDIADKFFDYFNATSWVDSKGNEVKNWKAKFVTWETYTPKPENIKRLPDPEPAELE
jgi:biotin operon repressor